MSGFYPFDVKPETFYEKGDFEVVYGLVVVWVASA